MFGEHLSPCIDLNKELTDHPAATFYGRVAGDSMRDAGVSEGDVLVIDKSLDAADGDMVVCFIDGEFMMKYISFSDPETGHREENAMWLVSANPDCTPLKVTDLSSFSVWGVVTYVIKKIRRRQ